MPEVALVVDNPIRDLRGMTLVAHQLASLGVSASLVPMYAQGYDLPLLAPDVVVVNYARESNRDLMMSYRHLGMQVAVLDTEGGILSTDGLNAPSRWAGTLRENGLASLVDHYLFWGETVHDAFSDGSGIAASRLCVTGCPRFDFCAPPWRSILGYQRQGHVLVNTNFSAINPRYSKGIDHEKALFAKLGWEPAYVQKLFDELQAVFPRYLEVVARLAAAFPERVFQVRPHPFENAQVYIDRFGDLSNVVVDGQGDVLNAIANSDCVLHLNCGTSVEASMLGKVPISMDFLNSDFLRYHSPLPTRLSCLASSEDMLHELVGAPQKREQHWDRSRANAQIEPWFFKNDGQAARRVARYLAAVTGSPTRRSLGLAAKGGRHAPSAGQRLQGLVNLALGSRAGGRLGELANPARKGKRLELEYVTSLLHEMAQCDHSSARRARYASNPITGAPLSTIQVTP